MKKPFGVAILVHNVDAIAGMERQAVRLAEGLARRGVRVTVLSTYFTPRLGLEGRPRARERRNGVDYVRVPFLDWWNYEALLLLFEIVAAHVLSRRRRSIDAIYAVEFTSGRHAAVLASILARPTVLKFAGGGEAGDLSRLRKDPNRARLERLIGSIDRYACVSSTLAREAKEAGLDERRFVSIRNGVPVERYAAPGPPAELPELACPGRRLVLYVGRLSSEKNPRLLVDAFLEVATRIPEARLAFAGTGPQEAELRARVRELGLAEKVAFLGNRDDVPALFRAASVYVLSSISEGLPNALLEALAAGTPCVATEIMGTREVVRDEVEALLVPSQDAPALARAIVRVLEDEALARRLVAAGRARVASEFDMNAVVEKYLATFRELAPTKRGRSVDLARLLELYARFVFSISKFFASIAFVAARRAVTAAVVATKKLLGVDRPLLAR